MQVRDTGVSDTAAAYTRPGSLTLNTLTVGAARRPATEGYFQGKVAQLVVVAGAPASATYEAIEAAQKTYYSTP